MIRLAYILITPIKDEKGNIPRLIKTILSQTLRPLLWVIVDSGSVDESYELANELSNEYEWIYTIRQKKFFEFGYGHKNFSQAINEGYEYSESICSNKSFVFDFIGKTDATPELSADYFSLLHEKMKIHPELAITCGHQRLIHRNKTIEIDPITNLSDTAINDVRLYRNDFFKSVGGYPLMPSPDTALAIKARNRGFRVGIVPDAIFEKKRLGGTKIGYFEGFKLKGKAMHQIGSHPLLALINAAYLSFKFPPHFQGFPVLAGYFASMLSREPKIDDQEILEYFGKQRIREIIMYLLGSTNNDRD